MVDNKYNPFTKSDDQMTRALLMVSLSIVFLIAIPLFIITLPFFLAWMYTRAIMDTVYKNREDSHAFDDAKWSTFFHDLSKWDKKGKSSNG